MKQPIEKREASGITDYIAVALTTFGVGYIPGAPGTYGSAIGVAIYLGIDRWIEVSRSSGDLLCFMCGPPQAQTFAFFSLLLVVFVLVGIWASSRTEAIFGNGDPSQAVVDEVMGQLIAFTFLPFGVGWPFILAGFLLFRFFDIIKPYPCRALEKLPGGLGICADDIVAGIYTGICLAIAYAIALPWLPVV